MSSIVVLALLLSAGISREASAQIQHAFGAAHQNWNVPAGSHTDIQQLVTVATEPVDGLFYTLQIGFSPEVYPDDGAYIGLQQGNGQRVARFSLWNAVTASPGPGASCRRFGEEGVGLTCEIPFNFLRDTTYTLRIRLSDPTAPGGPIWEGSVVAAGGSAQVIGRIQGPPGLGLVSWALSWIEYWGRDADATCWCSTLPPVAGAWFAAPLLNGASYAGLGSTSRGHCSGGRVTPNAWLGLSLIELGVDTTRWPEDPRYFGPPQCGADSYCAADGRCVKL